MNRVHSLRDWPLVGLILQHRFTKFGAVGFSGTMVNLVVLYLNQEILLAGIRAESRRLTYSLAIAIFVATVNNFLWNRYWTWKDRRGKRGRDFFVQMGQYFVASWFSILLQFSLTKIAARFTHYLIANVMAIVMAAVVTYLLNDVWTFAPKEPARSRVE